jgi:hypothetical protein
LEDADSVQLALDHYVDRDLFATLFMHSLLPDPVVARRKEDKEIRGKHDCNGDDSGFVITSNVAEY